MWDIFSDVSDAFANLGNNQSPITEDDLKLFEQYVVFMYDRASKGTSVNEARLDLFARKQKPYNLLLPSRNALIQHAKRAAFQAGHIWAQCITRDSQVQSPSSWGWWKDGDRWKITWTTLQPISECCRELTKCGCKSDCRGRCKCMKTGMDCTALCSCNCETAQRI